MGLFKNAEYVISDSFHGVVFSLLFNRKFFAKADGHHKNRRVEQLLKLVNLSDRTMNDVSDEQLKKKLTLLMQMNKLQISAISHYISSAKW